MEISRLHLFYILNRFNKYHWRIFCSSSLVSCSCSLGNLLIQFRSDVSVAPVSGAAADEAFVGEVSAVAVVGDGA
jgi:hypothetical protein